MNTEKKNEISAQEAAIAVMGVSSIAVYQKRALIEYWLIQNMDWLIFIGWLGVLALVFMRLKKLHKEMALERKSLLKLKSLENKQTKGGPGKPGPLGVVKPNTFEIEVGERISDGRRIKISDLNRLGQVQIPGATGRGKTESIILPWMVQDFRRGRSLCLIDGKGDPELVERFYDAVGVGHKSERVFVFDPMSPKSEAINPIASGSAQQITDRVMNSFNFEDPYYKSVQADALLTVVSLILEIENKVTFIGIEKTLTDMDHLSSLVNRSKDEKVKSKARSLIRQKDDVRAQNHSGLLTQLSPFTSGELAGLVNGDKDRSKQISLMDLLVNNQDQGSAILILLPTLIYQDVGRSLGRMILQELAYCVGMRAAKVGKSFPFAAVFLDEFSSFAYSGFEQILNKARSSQVALHLSHQSIGDLESVSPQFAKIVNTNTNVKCLLGLNDPDTAEFFARHMGTNTTEKFTERSEEREGLFSVTDERTGMKSIRETEIYKVHPNILKSMSSGQGVLHVPTKYGALTEEIQFFNLVALDEVNQKGIAV
jgi:uncharacterized protein YifN (PemK superfamily)